MNLLSSVVVPLVFALCGIACAAVVPQGPPEGAGAGLKSGLATTVAVAYSNAEEQEFDVSEGAGNRPICVVTAAPGPLLGVTGFVLTLRPRPMLTANLECFDPLAAILSSHLLAAQRVPDGWTQQLVGDDSVLPQLVGPFIQSAIAVWAMRAWARNALDDLRGVQSAWEQAPLSTPWQEGEIETVQRDQLDPRVELAHLVEHATLDSRFIEAALSELGEVLKDRSSLIWVQARGDGTEILVQAVGSDQLETYQLVYINGLPFAFLPEKGFRLVAPPGSGSEVYVRAYAEVAGASSERLELDDYTDVGIPPEVWEEEIRHTRWKKVQEGRARGEWRKMGDRLSIERFALRSGFGQPGRCGLPHERCCVPRSWQPKSGEGGSVSMLFTQHIARAASLLKGGNADAGECEDGARCEWDRRNIRSRCVSENDEGNPLDQEPPNPLYPRLAPS